METRKKKDCSISFSSEKLARIFEKVCDSNLKYVDPNRNHSTLSVQQKRYDAIFHILEMRFPFLKSRNVRVKTRDGKYSSFFFSFHFYFLSS